MEKDLNIHTKYGNAGKILISKRSAFLWTVAKKYNLKEEEIEIYEVGKNFKRKINVENLQDFCRVEIVKKPSDQINGLRPMENRPSVEEMCLKLQEKRPMTDQERELLLGHLKALPFNLKRRMENGNHQPPEMKNRKIQANPIDHNSAYTQTDKLLGFNPNIETNNTDLLQEIKKYAKKDKMNPQKVKELLAKSFNFRRNSLLKDNLAVAFLKEQYPILFTLSEIRNELDRILSDGTAEKFITNIEKYSKYILSMARKDDPLLLTTLQKNLEADSPLQKKYALEVGSILMLSSLISEHRNFLKLEDTSIPNFNEPYIEARTKLHGIFSNKHTFRIYAEHNLVCEATNFKEAILCLIACYFVFNIRYPDDNFNTLVVMEKIYLEAMDTKVDEIDDFTRQLIKSLQLKVAANER